MIHKLLQWCKSFLCLIEMKENKGSKYMSKITPASTHFLTDAVIGPII